MLTYAGIQGAEARLTEEVKDLMQTHALLAGDMLY
jgi:hypothetical protein